MRIKDFLKFLVCALLFVGAMYFLAQNTTPPQPPKKPGGDTKPTDVARGEALPTPGNAIGGITTHLAVQEYRERAARWKNKSDNWRTIGAVSGPAWAAAAATLRVAQSKKVTLGSADVRSPYHLQVEFDARGAAIRRLVLNKFKAANSLGKPEKTELELIPESNLPEEYRLDSSILYHYDSTDAARPLDTLGKTVWDIVKAQYDDEHSVSFQTVIQGVKITKTYRLPREAYHLALEVKIERANPSVPAGTKFRYQLTGGHGLPVEGGWYTSTFRHALICQLDKKASPWRDIQELRDIALKQGGDEVRKSSDRPTLQYAAIAVQYFASAIAVDDIQAEGQSRDFLASARPTLESRVVAVEVDGPVSGGDRTLTVKDNRDKRKAPETYTLTPDVAAKLASLNLKKGQKIALSVVPVNRDGDDLLVAVEVLPVGDSQPLFLDDITVRVNSESVELPADGQAVEHRFLLYNGPIKPMLLGQMRGVEAVPDEFVERYVDQLHLNTLTDYRSTGFFGSVGSTIGFTFLIIKFTNLCHLILNWLHWVIPSYGICIILLTVIVRGAMFPLSKKQALMGMKMQELAPELKKMKEKFKDDRQGFAVAQMELFRKHGVNPLGSCWMIFLQLPIFMGLYYCLQESVHFRLAPFLWISNLAAPDMLIKWGEGIPLLSRPDDYGSLLYLGPFLNVLPILAVTLMILQQKMMMPPAADEQQAMQQKIMKYMMIFFGLMFYKVAAGLCIYFIASSLWGFAERKWLPKKKTLAGGESADALYEKMRGDVPARPAEKEEPRLVGNGQQNAIPAGNRAKRRQDRKRQKERGEAQTANDSTAETARPLPTDGQGESWWANFRRRMSDWWQDVLKKASKK